jgi:predicted Zn finger-like uncharacterized protein
VVQFDCPQCQTPHAFPDAEIPDDGLVVACTKCAHHIELHGLIADDEDSTKVQPGIDPPAAKNPSVEIDRDSINAAFGLDASEDPRSVLSARIPLDEADWSDIDDSRVMPAPSLAGYQERPKEIQRHRLEGNTGGGAAVSQALSSLRGAVGFADAAVSDSSTPSSASNSNASDVSSRLGTKLFGWRDLGQALSSPFHARRFLAVFVGLWACLTIFGLIKWCALWLSSKNDIAGGLIGFLAWTTLLLGACLVMAFAAHQTFRENVEGQATTVRASVDWVQGWMSSILGAPLLCTGLMAIVVVAESLIGLLGRIPYAGPVIWGILSLAIVVTSLAAGLAMVGLAYGLFLYVPLIVSERTGAMDTLRRTVALYRENGLALVGMSTISLLASAVISGLTVLPAIFIARELSTRVAKVSMGSALSDTLAATPPPFMNAVQNLFHLGTLPLSGQAHAGHSIGGFFLGIAGMAVPALLATVFALLLTGAGAVIYAVATGRAKT